MNSCCGTRPGACMKTHTRPIDGVGRVMGLQAPASASPIADRGFFLAPAAFRAVAHFVPDIFPFLAPLKRSAADRAGFCGSIAGAFHRDPLGSGCTNADPKKVPESSCITLEAVLGMNTVQTTQKLEKISLFLAHCSTQILRKRISKVAQTTESVPLTIFRSWAIMRFQRD